MITDMNPLSLIARHHPPGTVSHRILLNHGREVAALATAVAARVARSTAVDARFVCEAAWLHDIGIGLTDAPRFGCHGTAPYLAHGVLGAELLRTAGLPRHALVCERHIGVGLSIADIDHQQLPLPRRDMRPQSVEEEIIAYADLFFSKTVEGPGGPRNAAEVRKKLGRFGKAKVAVFDDWHARFAPDAD
jgi:uncharacterized protein